MLGKFMSIKLKYSYSAVVQEALHGSVGQVLELGNVWIVRIVDRVVHDTVIRKTVCKEMIKYHTEDQKQKSL